MSTYNIQQVVQAAPAPVATPDDISLAGIALDAMKASIIQGLKKPFSG